MRSPAEGRGRSGQGDPKPDMFSHAGVCPRCAATQRLRSDADFILLVEKEAAYMRMAEDRFYQKYPCIVITAKGQPVRA